MDGEEGLPRDVGDLEFVHPRSPLWTSYVDVYVDYLIEEWPFVLGGSTREGVRGTSERNLIARLGEAGRFLVFYVEGEQRVAIANLYTSFFDATMGQRLAPSLVLNVAEFQVAHKYRRQGVGRRFLSKLRYFGRELNCRRFEVEVDLTKGAANEFWSSMLGPAILKNGRRVYSINLSA